MDYPQWLLPTFIRSARAAGATAPDEEITDAAERLITRWNGKDRHHHDLHHLTDVLSRVTALAPETHSPDLVRLAAYYHGCVFSTAEKDAYTRNGGENEVESARVARAELAELGIEEKKVDRIADLITGMKKQPREEDPCVSTTLSTVDIDKLALRDAHLGSLAAGPQKYAKYLEAVREEYAHIPAQSFLEARREIVKRLLARKQIFVSPLGRQWESQARENLSAELDRLEVKLAELQNIQIPAETEPPSEWKHPGLPNDTSDSVPNPETETEASPLTPEEYAQKRAENPLVPADRPSELEVLPSSQDDLLPRTLSQGAVREPEVVRSSLEDMPDEAEPGSPPRKLTPAERKKAERDDIAKRMQERLARRQAGLPEATSAPTPADTSQAESGHSTADHSKPVKTDAPRTKHTERSGSANLAQPPAPSSLTAVTPDWVDEEPATTATPDEDDDNGDGRAGFEREPAY